MRLATVAVVHRAPGIAGVHDRRPSPPTRFQARTSAKESGRHFDLYPWRKVPIPRYDGTIPLHREITALCTQAEKVAVRTVTAELEADPGREQVSLSKAVRNALANDGIAAAMDECARRLLPDQAE